MSMQPHCDPCASSPEMRLLLDCLRAPTQKHDMSGVDWDKFLILAGKHRCIPQVQKALSPHSTPANSTLTAQAIKIGLCNTRMIEVLCGIQHIFQSEGIRATCVKGPALSLLAYNDTVTRQFDDLDLVVSQADLPSAVDLLISNGYEPRQLSPRADLAAYLAAQHSVALQNREPTVYIDIGSVLISHILSTSRMAETALDRSTPLRIDDKRHISSPDAGLMMIILCMHGAEDMWEKFSLAGDVSALLRSHPDTDWSACLTRARIWGQLRCVLVGMIIARDLLGTQLPPPIEKELANDRAAAQLAGEVMRCMMAGTSFETGLLERMRFVYRTRERVRDRCRCLLRWLFVPGSGVMNQVRLPKPFRFLYPLLRPFRVLARLISL